MSHFCKTRLFIAVAENKRREAAKKVEEDRGMLDFMSFCYLLLVYLCILAEFDIIYVIFGLIFVNHESDKACGMKWPICVHMNI